MEEMLGFGLREAAKEALARYRAKRDMQAAIVLGLYEISQDLKRLEEKTDTGFKSQCADFQAYSNMLAGKIDVLGRDISKTYARTEEVYGLLREQGAVLREMREEQRTQTALLREISSKLNGRKGRR